MKLLVFAHTPPPHHGQSFMVQQMLEGFGGDQRDPKNRRPTPHGIECYHVNARVSTHLEDVGEFRPGKSILLLGYCIQAVWCRFRYGVENLYYVPAPGKRTALYRDWLVMALCRPFFKRLILHWHASGMARWLEAVPHPRTRALTYHLIGNADLSVVLSRHGRRDGEKLYPKSVAIVGNGIEDPCPEFEQKALPARKARLAARQKLLAGGRLTDAERDACQRDPAVYNVLFLSHCTREKGLFEAIDGVLIANRRLKQQNSPIRISLTVAGTFMHPEDKAEFDRILRQDEAASQVQYVGFAMGAEKQRLFVDADVFCFPSYMESFGLVVAEAMACGLPIIATRCGALPEILPEGYPLFVRQKRSDDVANALETSMHMDQFESLRSRYRHYLTVESQLSRLAEAIKAVEHEPAPAFPEWEHLPAELR